MMRHPIPTALLACSLLAGTAAHAEGLDLTVENVRSERGSVIVLVFDNARDFDRLDYLRVVDYADVPARPGDMEIVFPGLTRGPYAVFLFHDENADQDLNHIDGYPLEGIGATGAPNPDDMPSFEDAAVFPGRATVVLHYGQ